MAAPAHFLLAAKAAAGGFVPTDIAGLELWLDASDAGSFTYGTGDNVSQWNDLSGNTRHATQGTGATQPNRTGTINSLTTVTFASGDRMTLPSFMSGKAAGTVFMVGKLAQDPPASAAASGPVVRLGSEGSGHHMPYTDGTIYDNTGSTVRKTVGNPTPSLASAFYYTVITASGDWKARLNGTQIYSTATNTVGWRTTAPNAEVGYDLAAGSFVGQIAEIIVYSSALTGTDLSDVEGYIADKWGI